MALVFGSVRWALSTVKDGESWAAGSRDLKNSSTKSVGFLPSAPSARPIMRMLFLLHQFSASPAQYSNALTLDCRERIMPVLPTTLSFTWWVIAVDKLERTLSS